MDPIKAEASYSSKVDTSGFAGGIFGGMTPVINQYNTFTAPYDSNEQDKANEKALNTIAFSH